MTKQEAQELIDDIIKFRQDRLNDWEIKFIESIDNWHGDLTDNQSNCLTKIYDSLMR